MTNGPKIALSFVVAAPIRRFFKLISFCCISAFATSLPADEAPGATSSSEEKRLHSKDLDRIKANILDALLNPKTSKTDTDLFLFQYKGRYFEPWLLSFGWTKAIFSPFGVDALALPENVVNLTARERIEHAGHVKIGNDFRLDSFKKMWAKALTDQSVPGIAYRRLEKLLAPVEFPSVRRRLGPLNHQSALLKANAKFESIYRKSPDQATWEEQQSFKRMLNEIETFHEEENPHQELLSSNPPLEKIRDDLKNIKTLLARQTSPDFNRESIVAPDTIAYKQGAYHALSKALLGIIGTIETTLSDSDPKGSVEAARSVFNQKFRPLATIENFDNQFGPVRSPGLLDKDFLEFIRSIKWWGLSQNPEYWKQKDSFAMAATSPLQERFFLPRVRSRLTDFNNLRRGVTLAAIVITKLIAYTALLLLPLRSYVNHQLIDSRDVAIHRETGGADSSISKTLSDWIKKIRDAFGVHKVGAPKTDGTGSDTTDFSSQGPDTENEDPNSDLALSPDLGAPMNFDPDSVDGLKARENFKAIPLSQKGDRAMTLPFIFSSDWAYGIPASSEFSGGYRIVDSSRRFPQADPDSDLRVESLRDLRPNRGQIAIPTPLGFEVSAISYGKNPFNVYEDIAGHFFLKMTRPATPAPFKVEFRAKKDPVLTHRVPELDNLSRNQVIAWAKGVGAEGFSVADYEVRERVYDSEAPLSAEDFTSTLSASMIYSIQAPNGKFSTRQISPFNISFSRNLLEGDFIGHCQDGNLFLEQALGKILGTQAVIQVVAEQFANSEGILSWPGHAQTLILNESGKIQAWLDGTPRQVTEKSVLFKGAEARGQNGGAPPPSLARVVWATEGLPKPDIVEVPPQLRMLSEKTPRDPFISNQRERPRGSQKEKIELVVDPPRYEETLREMIQKTAEESASANEAWRIDWIKKIDHQIDRMRSLIKTEKLSIADSSLPQGDYVRLLIFCREFLAARFNSKFANESLAIGDLSFGFEIVTKKFLDIQKKYFDAKYRLASDPLLARKYGKYFGKNMEELMWGAARPNLIDLATRVEELKKSAPIIQKMTQLPVNRNCSDDLRAIGTR